MTDAQQAELLQGENVCMICPACQNWIEPLFDKVAHTVRCPQCSHVEARRFFPLFIVTGPSGGGKTAVVPELQRLLPAWEVFETDILWDSGNDWNMIKANWLRIADSLAQRPHGRPTILCGTMQPEDIVNSGLASHFSTIYWLALVCSTELLRERLRARPAWRGFNEELITEHETYLAWLHANAQTAFDPPLKLLDTTGDSIADTARQITDWAMEIWQWEVQQ